MATCGKRSENPQEAAAAMRRNICAVCAPMGLGCCPIGPELKAPRGYHVIGHSIQIIECKPKGRNRWKVAALFSGFREDLRFPVRCVDKRRQAEWIAFDYARHYLGGGDLDEWCRGDWIVRNGRESIIILVVRL